MNVLGIARVSLIVGGLAGPACHHLRETDDGVERRAELVAHIGEKLGLGAKRGRGVRRGAVGFRQGSPAL
jgi:hypothetical protein